MKLLHLDRWGVGALVALVAMALVGCGGAPVPPSTDGDTTNTPIIPDGVQTTGTIKLRVYDDPEVALAAAAQADDGTEYAIYADKDSNGAITQLFQVDLMLSGGGAMASLELDEAERPARIETGDGANATFYYDDDTGTVQMEVSNASGNTVVDQVLRVGASGAKRRPPWRTTRLAGSVLCDRLEGAREVLAELFACPAGDDKGVCQGALGEVAAALHEFCMNEMESVDDLETSLGVHPREIPLGIRPNVTTRPTGDGMTTVVLAATTFGGRRPMASVTWSWVFGPEETDVENLPDGVGVTDLTRAGEYVFRVEAVDAEGTRVSADVEVGTGTLLEVEIVATPEYPGVGEVVEFQAETELIFAAGADSVYQWDFGDGEVNSGQGVTHAFLAPGEYAVSVLVAIDGARAKATLMVYVGEDVRCEDVCQQGAETAYLDCLQRGSTADDCAARSGAALEMCVEERCGTGFDCASHCRVQSGYAMEDCVAGGGSPEECAAAAIDTHQLCFEEQCGEHVVCAEGCDYLAEQLLTECLAAGESEVACGFVVDQGRQQCVEKLCGQVVDCPMECGEVTARMFAECRQGGGSEGECSNRGRDYMETCLVEECGIEPECETLCAEQATAVFSDCVSGGGDPTDCQGSFEEFLRQCLQEECGEDFSDIGTCEELCFEDSESIYTMCRESGEADEVCVGQAEDAYDACLLEQCDEDGGDESRCAEECFEESEAFFVVCVAQGGSEWDCASESDTNWNTCLVERCGEIIDDGGGCEEECGREADLAWDECFDTGGVDFECDQLWVDVFDACLEETCGETLRRRPRCEDVCFRDADWVMTACRQDGGVGPECRGEWSDTFDDCVREDCAWPLALGGPSSP